MSLSMDLYAPSNDSHPYVPSKYICIQSTLKVDQILARGTSNQLEEFRADARAVGLRDLHRICQVCLQFVGLVFHVCVC